MIKSFRHKGLEKLFKTDSTVGVAAMGADKMTRILARLNIVVSAEEMNIPSFRLHPLKGDMRGF